MFAQKREFDFRILPDCVITYKLKVEFCLRFLQFSMFVRQEHFRIFPVSSFDQVFPFRKNPVVRSQKTPPIRCYYPHFLEESGSTTK